MKYDPEIHHRRTIRLKGCDYSRPGYYFVTICIQNNEHLFGDIISGKMILNESGNMIRNKWAEIPKFYSNIDIDEFIVMPNHIHGIIKIIEITVGAIPCDCPIINEKIQTQGPDKEGQTRGSDKEGQTQGSAPTRLSLSNVVQRFKSITTRKYIDGIRYKNWKPFDKRLWQRNYYERIIRNENELHDIRNYIIENPAKWELDGKNPINL